MKFFKNFWTKTYCLSLKKSIFGKKKIFWKIVFEILLSRGFTFRAQKLMEGASFLNVLHFQMIALDPRIILGPIKFRDHYPFWVKLAKN